MSLSLTKLLLDPIRMFDTIAEDVIYYYQTVFRSRYPEIEKEKKELLKTDGVFYRQPWVEAIPTYKSSGKRIQDLTAEDLPMLSADELELFKGLVGRGLFPNDRTLYTHQLDMLRLGLQGKPSVITSGTGSGKTESFMLPLLAQLARELVYWNTHHPCADDASSDRHKWWDSSMKRSDFVDKKTGRLQSKVQQRGENISRPAALRGLLLYPMNALVEDQMTRLRTTLDSDEVRKFLRDRVHAERGNLLYFGRYNSSTPVAGSLLQENGNLHASKPTELKEVLAEAAKNLKSVREYIDASEEERKDMWVFFPRLDGAEMRTRFDMQVTPPDLMITNYSMLSIMLMRSQDLPIIEQTRKWLHMELEADKTLSDREKEEQQKLRIFHLVIDELHLYRGTAGTEVAYLLRLLLHRLGLNSEHPQLRFLASSASLDPDDKDSRDYLKDFFGTNKAFEIVPGEAVWPEPEAGISLDAPLPASVFQAFAKRFDEMECEQQGAKRVHEIEEEQQGHSALRERTLLAFENALPSLCQEHIAPLAQYLHTAVPQGEDALQNFLQLVDYLSPKVAQAFHVEGRYRAIASFPMPHDGNSLKSYLSVKLFGEGLSDQDARLAVRGLLMVRALFDSLPGLQTKMPRLRFHYFFKSIDGLWAEAALPTEERPVGKLYAQSRHKGDAGNRVFDLLRCEHCGTVMYGGKRLPLEGNTLEMLSHDPISMGTEQNSIHEGRAYVDYALFYPQAVANGTAGGIEESTATNTFSVNVIGKQVDADKKGKGKSKKEQKTDKEVSGHWQPAYLNIHSGLVQESNVEGSSGWIPGFRYAIEQVDENPQAVAHKQYSAMPAVCPYCGKDHQYSSYIKSPIRGFRTGFGRISEIFSSELFQQLPDDQDKRKLVTFSDSRQDAAKLAKSIKESHYRELMRNALVYVREQLLRRKQYLADIHAGVTTLGDYSYEIQEQLQAFMINPKAPQAKQAAIQQKIKQLNDLVLDVSALIPQTETVGDFINFFLQLGVNPGGESWAIQQHIPTGSDIKMLWNDFFDVDLSEYRVDTHVGDFRKRIEPKILQNLVSMFFGRLAYNFESAGIGYVTIDRSKMPSDCGKLSPDKFEEACAGFTRVLGAARHEYTNALYGFRQRDVIQYSDFGPRYKDYIRALASRHNVDERELGEAFITYFGQQGHGDMFLELRKLKIQFVDEAAPVYICTSCHTSYLHAAAGICTTCFKPLPDVPSMRVEELQKENYMAISEWQQRKPTRLRAEELTGQTDNPFERQRYFRNILVGEDGAHAHLFKGIDMLCVTTTLEVGVDIGALQAVMLANMPPQRFNYQQRVGRAGRRGQAYSIVLTLCRSRSHDEHYFNHPERITGDTPPTPTLSMEQPEIRRRLLVKELLFMYFSDPENKTNGGLHGEFGSIEAWPGADAILAWAETHQDRIKQVMSRLGETDGNFVQEVLQKIDYLKYTLGDGDIVDTDDLGEFLARKGILPMFGMPTQVKDFYHTLEKKHKKLQLNAVSRPEEQAVSEFLPGSQLVKDGSVHTCIGVSAPLELQGDQLVVKGGEKNEEPFSARGWAVVCKDCGFKKLLPEEEEESLDHTCPCCERTSLTRVQVAVPKAYRSDLTPGADKEQLQMQMSTRLQSYTTMPKENQWKQSKHHQVSYSLHEQDQVWKLSEPIKGYYTTMWVRPFGGAMQNALKLWVADDMYPRNGYLSEDARDAGYSGHISPLQEGTQPEEIAFLARKVTDVFRLWPAAIPEGIDLTAFTDDNEKKGASLAVCSAFYTAAFILQRVLADKLDVDPEEIEVAELLFKDVDTDVDTQRTAMINLADTLVNGSGFVKNLHDKFPEYLKEIVSFEGEYLQDFTADDHDHHCQDACYKCLKGYRNMNYHGRLDWRLGFALLRLFDNDQYRAGLFQQEWEMYPELKQWRKLAGQDAKSFEQAFEGYTYLDKALPVLERQTYDMLVIVVHPFWDTKKPIGVLKEIFDELKQDYPDKEICFIDSFNLHRRPGWCHQTFSSTESAFGA